MDLLQTVKLAWVNIKGNKLRSFLTMLGMIIGVASVITLVSLMDNVTNEIISSFEGMGINSVSVTIIGRNGDPILKEEDMYQYVKEHQADWKGVTPTINTGGNLRTRLKKLEGARITGVDEMYLQLNNKKLQSGTGITYSDVTLRRKCCVIGSYINNTLFNGVAKAGDVLTVNGVEFIVEGVLEQSSDSSEWSEDNCFYIPYTTGMRMVEGGSNLSYTFYAKDSNNVASLTKQIQYFLFNTFKDEKCYSVTNMADLLKEVKKQQSMLTLVVGGIAGISLLVAGIGIMNIMLVSVSERTKEIGIRKSLGAKRRDIMRQFVIEAATTSMIGGLIGIIVGDVITIKMSGVIGVKSTMEPKVILLAFGISVGIGILFGYLPANKAAKLNPIDALRNE